MIQIYSRLDVADNSGAKKVMCFHVFGGTRRRYGSLGDVIMVPRQDVISTGLTVEEGIRIILSAGTATPARLPRERL